MKKYSVKQTFAMFGDPGKATFRTLSSARRYADSLAASIAEAFWGNGRVGDFVRRPVCETLPSGTGDAAEAAWEAELDWQPADPSEWTDPDRLPDYNDYRYVQMPWQDLVAACRKAIKIEEI